MSRTEEVLHVRSKRAPLLLAGVLTLLLAARAPQATQAPPPAEVPAEASELQRVAIMAFHRMELGRLETGSYTTNALIDLELPRQVRWTLEEFDGQSYRLRFTSDSSPDEAWLVTPRGVSGPTGG